MIIVRPCGIAWEQTATKSSAPSSPPSLRRLNAHDQTAFVPLRRDHEAPGQRDWSTEQAVGRVALDLSLTIRGLHRSVLSGSRRRSRVRLHQSIRTRGQSCWCAPRSGVRPQKTRAADRRTRNRPSLISCVIHYTESYAFGQRRIQRWLIRKR